MIVIVDYGMGNLRSVQKAFEKVGHSAEISDRPEAIARAGKVVLPGVGAFADAMTELRRRGLIEPIRDAVAAGKPFLGVCLGLQLLFTTSYEDGEHAGLDLLRGEVRRFPVGSGVKVPHMGWNQVELVRRPPIFEGVGDGTYFYFVHSYYAVPQDPELEAGRTAYPDSFTSVVWRENIFATQFHPEKSQREGLRLLRNFAEL